MAAAPNSLARADTSAARVLIIAPHGSYRTFSYLEAAKRLGLRALVASEGRYSIVDAYARGLHIAFTDEPAALAQIVAEARRDPFIAIIGTDDTTTEISARAAELLALPHNPPQAMRIARRKDLARDVLQAAGVNKPSHRHLFLDQAWAAQCEGLDYPVVVKPIALSASRGVIRADDQTQLFAAIARIERLLKTLSDLEPFARRQLLIETFIPGAEVAIEGLLHNGRLSILAIFDKPEPLNGPYFEESYYITPSRYPPSLQQQLREIVEQAARAYGLREGPIHAECRINDHGIYILEVAARTIGGLCARLLRFGTGYSLEELVLMHALGQSVTSKRQEEAAGVLMIPIPRGGVLKRVEGILAAQRVPCIEDIAIEVHEGQELVPLPEGSSYLGFIFARAPTPEQVEAALRTAQGCLRFIIAPHWRLEQAGLS